MPESRATVRLSVGVAEHFTKILALREGGGLRPTADHAGGVPFDPASNLVAPCNTGSRLSADLCNVI
jgi:hypothetical protein